MQQVYTIEKKFAKGDRVRDIVLKKDLAGEKLLLEFVEKKMIGGDAQKMGIDTCDLKQLTLSRGVAGHGENSYFFVRVDLDISGKNSFPLVYVKHAFREDSNVHEVINEGEKLSKFLNIGYTIKLGDGTKPITRQSEEIGRPFTEFLARDGFKSAREFTATPKMTVQETPNGDIKIDWLLNNHLTAMKNWTIFRTLALVIFLIIGVTLLFVFNPPGTGSDRAATAGINMLIIMVGFILTAIFWFTGLSYLNFRAVYQLTKEQLTYSENYYIPILKKEFAIKDIKYFVIGHTLGSYEFLVISDTDYFRFRAESAENLGHHLTENITGSLLIQFGGE